MATIEKLGRVRFRGMLDDKNVSAIAFWKERALVVTDEVTKAGSVVQALEKDGDDFCPVSNGLIKLDKPNTKREEMDLEGIAVDGQTVFVPGFAFFETKEGGSRGKV